MRAEREAEFETFVAAVSDRMFRTAYAITRDHQLAEDAVQSALASAYAKWRRVSRADQPEAYVRRMVVNEVIGWRRRRSSTERPTPTAGPGGGHSPEDRIVETDAVWGALSQLAAAAAGRGRAPLLRAPVRGRDRRRPRHPAGHGEVAVLGRPRQPAPAPRTGHRDEGGARMNIEQTITETIERHVATSSRRASTWPPYAGWAGAGPGSAPRSWPQPWPSSSAVASYAVDSRTGAAPREGHQAGRPAADGLRRTASRLVQPRRQPGPHGWREFDIGNVPDLDTSASTTPYGLVFFGADQDVRLLRDDGSVTVLAAAPDDPRDFYPDREVRRRSSRSPPGSPGRRGWPADGLPVRPGQRGGRHVPGALRLRASWRWPASTRGWSSCAGRSDVGARPGPGRDAEWQPVADAEVADVRNGSC